MKESELEGAQDYINDFDSDQAYERYRDDDGDRLEAEIKEFVKNKCKEKGYYNDSKDKLIRHMIHILEFELKLMNNEKENEKPKI